MASQRKASRSQAGSTMYGVLAGLLIGLAIAAVVAFYVTRAPMPFVDKATRQADQGKMPDLSQADPNQGLSGGTVTVPPAPGPGGGNEPKGKMDDLGALIATLPSNDKKPADAAIQPVPVPAAPPAPAPASKPAVVASAAPKAAPAAPAAAASTANGAYFLQAGAYKQASDAESVRARVLLLGLQASIQRAEVNGAQWNRVRVGPFAKLDDMNRARIRLADNKIDSTVVRQ